MALRVSEGAPASGLGNQNCSWPWRDPEVTINILSRCELQLQLLTHVDTRPSCRAQGTLRSGHSP